MTLLLHETQFCFGHERERALSAADEFREVESSLLDIEYIPERIACRILRYLRFCIIYRLPILDDERTHLTVDVSLKSVECLLLRELVRSECFKHGLTTIGKHHFHFFYVPFGLSVFERALAAGIIVH